MAKVKKMREPPTIEQQIAAKSRKIKKLFADLSPERKQFAEGLIYQYSVASVTLDRLADEINSTEVIEMFEQGEQKMRRENPAIKSYNTTVKSYTALSKSLLDLLPDKSQKAAGEELLAFAMQPRSPAKK